MLSWSWSTCLTRLRFPLKTDDVYSVFVLYFLFLLLKWKTTWDHWNRGSSKYPAKEKQHVEMLTFGLFRYYKWLDGAKMHFNLSGGASTFAGETVT